MSHQYPYPPQQPQRKSRWPWILLVILAACFVFVGGCSAVIAAVAMDPDVTATEPTAEPTTHKPAAEPPTDKPEPTPTPQPKSSKKDPSEDHVIFKVWGDGNPQITYGSDSSNHEGTGGLPFRKRIKLDESSLYYSVTAQLMGGGNIKCSVTINGVTEKGAASGGYNICSAQINGGITGWG